MFGAYPLQTSTPSLVIRSLVTAFFLLAACAKAPLAAAPAARTDAPPTAPGTIATTALATVPAGTMAAERTRQAQPALVVLVSVDQFLPRYLERWQSQFTGGLAELLNHGSVFTQAYHDHAITETAPGHASLLSGRFPYSTGIAANSAGVTTSDAPLIGASDYGASPFRFQGTTLADWMTAVNPDARVLSVSRKDRGAILPIGRGKHSVFWYAMSNGAFTTSSYYAESLPEWVQAYNAEGNVMKKYAGTFWQLSRPDSLYTEPDSVAGESFGQGFLFPHFLPPDELSASNIVIGYPFMDELTLDFAMRGVNAMKLGQRGQTDLLSVSLSTTDAVGHRWGPESREMHDNVLRLDAALGVFLDSLSTLVGRERLAVVFTADHGVAPSPDFRAASVNNDGAGRVMLDDFDAAIRSSAVVAARGEFPLEALNFDGNTLTVDRSIITDRDRDIRAIAQAFKKDAQKVPGVLRVDLLEDLARADTVRDHIARRWLHMFRPGGDVIAVVTLTPYSILGTGNVATHGSPHDYDAHVPLIFWGSAFNTMHSDSLVRVVDIGPTLAALLSVPVTEQVDGRVLQQAFRESPAGR